MPRFAPRAAICIHSLNIYLLRCFACCRSPYLYLKPQAGDDGLVRRRRLLAAESVSSYYFLLFEVTGLDEAEALYLRGRLEELTFGGSAAAAAALEQQLVGAYEAGVVRWLAGSQWLLTAVSLLTCLLIMPSR